MSRLSVNLRRGLRVNLRKELTKTTMRRSVDPGRVKVALVRYDAILKDSKTEGRNLPICIKLQQVLEQQVSASVWTNSVIVNEYKSFPTSSP